MSPDGSAVSDAIHFITIIGSAVSAAIHFITIIGSAVSDAIHFITIIGSAVSDAIHFIITTTYLGGISPEDSTTSKMNWTFLPARFSIRSMLQGMPAASWA